MHNEAFFITILAMDEKPSHYSFVVTFHFKAQEKPPQGEGMISVSAQNEREARRIAKHRIHDMHRENIGENQIVIDSVELLTGL